MQEDRRPNVNEESPESAGSDVDPAPEPDLAVRAKTLRNRNVGAGQRGQPSRDGSTADQNQRGGRDAAEE